MLMEAKERGYTMAVVLLAEPTGEEALHEIIWKGVLDRRISNDRRMRESHGK